jgi:hypothetical protein
VNEDCDPEWPDWISWNLSLYGERLGKAEIISKKSQRAVTELKDPEADRVLWPRLMAANT